MNPLPLPPNPADDEHASLWAARLDASELTAADHRELAAWLAGHPTRRTRLSQYCDFSDELATHLPGLVATGTVALSVPARAPRARWWPALAGAGLVAAAACAAFLHWTGQLAPTPAQPLVSPAGMRRTLTLADGTRVDLNAQTQLTAQIDRRSRHVLLPGGEAYFSVTHDAARPFVITTPGGTVRVTGTEFDVRTETGHGLEVVVAQGSVLFSPVPLAGHSMEPIALSAGSRLKTNEGRVTVEALSPTALDDALAWRHGQVVFNDTPLKAALACFARFHGRGISTDATTVELRVGGRYSLDDLDGFLAALEEVLPIRAQRHPDGTVLVCRRAES